MTLEGTLDFHINLAGWKGTEFEKLDKAKKKDFIENTPKEEGAQAFAFGTKGDKCTWESKIISFSRSSISTLVRFQQKIRSQDIEVSLPKMAEMDG